MSALNNSLLLGQEGGGGYAISRSLRFNAADSSFLSRTPASAGNRKTWTWAGWVKFSAVAGAYGIFEAPFQSGGAGILSDVFEIWYSSGTIHLTDYSTYYFTSATKFRDPSAWQHFVFTCDTTQATASNRFKVYQNGVQLVNTASATITQNLDTAINNTAPHGIASWRGTSANAYLADIHFCDGYAYDPSYFTEFDDNGILQPIAFTGTYGTNGFHLDFADNSTAAALGTDSSGNGNTWTVNNLSVTAGAGNDSLVDVPTNGSEVDTGAGGQVRGNYCTWNPLDKSSSVDLSNGNLTNVGTTTNVMCRSTIFVSSGKWYYEVTLATYSGNPIFGWASSSANLASWVGNSTSSWGYAANAMKYSNGGGSSYGASFGAGDVVGVAADLDAGTLVFYKNGVSQGTAYSNLSGALCPAFSSGASTTVDFNFGQRPFAYPVSGFKALNTSSLPAPVITKPSTVMDVKLYTGNGSTQTISTDFSPDFLWFKARGDSGQHALYDIVRGASKSLVSNSTAAEATEGGGLASFDSAGFSLSGDNTIQGSTNGSGRTYVTWAWDAGSSTVTNTAGSISSQVRANASAGFSIVTYTGNGTGGATVGHGLGVSPALILLKSRGGARNWVVYSSSLTSAAYYLSLNQTIAQTALSTVWNSTAPTSTVFSIGTDLAVNNSSENYVAYCFAPVAGYSAFGSYTGNGSTDGPFVYCGTGFRPAFVLIKATGAVGGNWMIYDNRRAPSNLNNKKLAANTALQENETANLGDDSLGIDFLSNGFKIRQTGGNHNNSGTQYIYFAVAESPFQYARAR